MVHISTDHLNRFRAFAQKAKTNSSEPDFVAAIYVLSAPLLSGKVDNYIGDRIINFSEMMVAMNPWSSGEKALIKLSAALYNSAWEVNINEVFWPLDPAHVKIALEALKIRFGDGTLI